MAKYSFKFKLKIVQEYFEGEGGYRYLANKHEIKSCGQVRYWIKAYTKFGEEGLYRKRQNQKYSVQFKLDAIELYQTSDLSYREVANVLEPLLASWMQKFRDNGVDGLSKRKGNPSTLTKKTEMKKNVPAKHSAEATDRIKELEKQVRSLQIENAFLKGLRKLRKHEAQ